MLYIYVKALDNNCQLISKILTFFFNQCFSFLCRYIQFFKETAAILSFFVIFI